MGLVSSISGKQHAMNSLTRTLTDLEHSSIIVMPRATCSPTQIAEAVEAEKFEAKSTSAALTSSVETIFSLEGINGILPDRYLFLLVDKVVEYEQGKRAIGVKAVTLNEPPFTGHFPDRPIMPGVLQSLCVQG